MSLDPQPTYTNIRHARIGGHSIAIEVNVLSGDNAQDIGHLLTKAVEQMFGGMAITKKNAIIVVGARLLNEVKLT